MIKVNIGDFVETIDGKVGYVINVELGDRFNVIDVKIDMDICCWYIFNDKEYDLSEHFKRIGSHDFTAKVKENKIEPLINKVDKIKNGLGITLMNYRTIASHEEVVDKINEIIAYINKEEK